MKYYRPLPLDTELKISPRALLISRTDIEGNIIYINKNLLKYSYYEKEELINAPHSILRHPDMPRVIFFLLWKELKQGKRVTLLIKNLTKTGEYYWVQSHFKRVDDDPLYQPAYMATSEAAPKSAILKIEQFYKRLLIIEKKEGLLASLNYLEKYLQERDLTLQEYMNSMLEPKTIISSLFKKIKNSLSLAA